MRDEFGVFGRVLLLSRTLVKDTHFRAESAACVALESAPEHSHVSAILLQNVPVRILGRPG